MKENEVKLLQALTKAFFEGKEKQRPAPPAPKPASEPAPQPTEETPPAHNPTPKKSAGSRAWVVESPPKTEAVQPSDLSFSF